MTNKSLLFVKMIVATAMPVAVLAAKMRAAYGKHIPIGYEDEDGFHFGSKPG